MYSLPVGRVIVWDRGTYTNEAEDDVADALERRHLSFRLDGEKLHGGFALTRFRTGKDEAWLLVKKSDDDADGRRNRYAANRNQWSPAARSTSCHERSGAHLELPHPCDADRRAVSPTRTGFSSGSPTGCGAWRFATAAACGCCRVTVSRSTEPIPRWSTHSAPRSAPNSSSTARSSHSRADEQASRGYRAGWVITDPDEAVASGIPVFY
jgi:hypothetical protein